MVFENTRTCRIGFLAIAASCFIIGFISQVVFQFKSQHHYSPSHSHLKSLSNNDMKKISEIEERFSSQLLEIEKLKKLIELNKNPVNSGNEKSDGVILDTHLIGADSPTSSSSSLLLSAITDDMVPNIVRSWRRAKLDWHQLLPLHNSIWERYGTPEKGKGLRLLVSKEIQVTNFLTQFHESGLSAKYGKNHGSLSQYSGCNSFLSTCMVHDKEKCQLDQLCSWNKGKELCVDQGGPDADITDLPQKSCANPRILNQDGSSGAVDPSQCKFFVNQPAVFVSIDSESQSMFYHWWASWSTLVQYWQKNLQSSRQVHFFIAVINDPMFFDFFGLISDNCWRRNTRTYVQVPAGACFCNTHELHTSQSRTNPIEAASQMVEYLKLTEMKPPPKQVKIGIISRRLKRFILNEYELVSAVIKMGYECVLLPLETMTMYEQMRELRSIDVLIGIHGSALDNSVFLHKGTYERTYERTCTYAL